MLIRYTYTSTYCGGNEAGGKKNRSAGETSRKNHPKRNVERNTSGEMSGETLSSRQVKPLNKRDIEGTSSETLIQTKRRANIKRNETPGNAYGRNPHIPLHNVQFRVLYVRMFTFDVVMHLCVSSTYVYVHAELRIVMQYKEAYILSSKSPGRPPCPYSAALVLTAPCPHLLSSLAAADVDVQIQYLLLHTYLTPRVRLLFLLTA